MINLYDHKIFVEAHKMEMVPLSIALQAVEEAQNNSKSINQGPNDLNIDNYINQLESAMKELQTSVKNLDVND